MTGHRFLLLAIALGLLAACPSSRERGEGDDDDSGEDDDDASSDDDDAASAPCGVYDPYDVPGAWWDWALHPDFVEAYGYDQQWTVEALGPTTWRGQPVLENRTEGVMDNSAHDWFEWESSTYFACDDDGVWSFGYETTSSWSVSGTPGSVTSTAVYTTPWLLRPADLQPGDEWHAVGSGEFSDSNGNESTIEIDIWYAALETGAVTTPAGSFEGLRVRSEAAEAEPSWFWLVAGVGHVATEDHSWLVDTSM